MTYVEQQLQRTVEEKSLWSRSLDYFSLFSGGGVNKLEYIIPLGALSGIILVVPALYYRKRIRRCIRKRPAEEDDEERRPVIHGNDAEDYGARHEDLQNAPCPFPAGPSSGSNNPRDNINNELSRARHGNIERC